MKNFLQKSKFVSVILSLACIVLIAGGCAIASTDTTESGGIYQQKQFHNPDGIGKVYMGREIAKVMGHQGAMWLERPSREIEEKPSEAIASLDVNPTDIVADIGAGTGYISFRISPLVPEGKVLAVDVQPEMLDIIEFLKKENNATNVETVLGTVNDPKLPESSIDLAIMVDAYHEFEYPREMMERIVAALKPGGRVVLVEYRGENPLIAIKPLHKMSQKQVKKEMDAVGLVWRETKNSLPQQHVMIFEKTERQR